MRLAIDGAALGSGRGGDETFVVGLIEALASTIDEAHRVTVYMRRGVPQPGELKSDPRFEFRYLASRSGMRRLLLDLPLALRRDSPEVLVATVHGPMGTTVPIALQVPDLSFLHVPELFPTSTRWRLRSLVGYQVRRAALVLTVSESSKADIVSSYGVDPGRVAVLPNVVAPPTAPPDSAVVRAWQEEREMGDDFLLYLGNIHPRKNVERLIEAFRRIQSVGFGQLELLIAGSVSWGPQPRCGSGVRCLGRVPTPVRDHLLNNARALVYPSLFEGFGLPPLEAMARGTPVVASNISAIRETVGDAAVLVDPFDVNAIAAGIVSVLEDEGLREVLVTRGRQRVQHFSRERVGRVAVDLFEGILNGHQTEVPT